MKKKKIYVYDDLGSSQYFVYQMKNFLKLVYPPCNYSIRSIKAVDILNRKLEETDENGELSVFLLVMGGGYDLGYLEALGLDGSQLISEFVQLGGNYLGVCAGGYFACNHVQFDIGGKYEVQGERYVKLFNGTAVGPYENVFHYDKTVSATAISVAFDENCAPYAQLRDTFHRSRFHMLLNGGFYLVPNDANFKPVAFYDNGDEKKLAIVECAMGKGKCLLSGVHFEFNANDIKFLNNDLDPHVNQLLLQNIPFSSMNTEMDELLVKHSNYLLANILLKSVFNE